MDNTRVRITLTIAPDIIRLVDDIATEQNRSRSNVIETALIKTFQPQPDQAK